MRRREVQVFGLESSGHTPRSRTDSCWSWLVCIAGTVSVVIVVGLVSSFGLLLPIWMETFEANRQQIAWIGSLYISSGCILYPVGCYLTGRFGYRFAAALGSTVGIIGFTLASFSSKVWMLYLTYGIFAGFGHIMIYNSCFLAVLQYFAKWRSLAVSIVASGSALGMLAMSQLTQTVLGAFDWQWTVRGFSGLYFVCGLCSTLFVPLENQGETRKSDDMNIEEDRAPPLYRDISFIIFLISITILLMVNFVPHVHIIQYCAQELDIPSSKSSMLYTYYAIASFFSRHLFCKLGDYINRLYLYQVGMTICGLSVVCLPLARSFGSVVALFVVNGLFEGSMNGQWSLLLYECVGRNKVDQAMGYFSVCTGVGFAIGPSLAGLMADEFGSYAPSFYTAGALGILGATMGCLVSFTKHKIQSHNNEDISSDEFLLVSEKVTVL